MLNLFKFTLLTLAFVLATGCHSQPRETRVKSSRPPWGKAVVTDTLNTRQESISTQLQAHIPDDDFVFDQLRHDPQSGLEYYIFSDGAYDGLLIVFTVDPIKNTVINLGQYSVQDGWNAINVDERRFLITP